jgi:hypothetical protein
MTLSRTAVGIDTPRRRSRSLPSLVLTEMQILTWAEACRRPRGRTGIAALLSSPPETVFGPLLTQMRRCRFRGFATLTLLLLVGCHSDLNRGAIEREAAILRKDVSDSRYQQIYDNADVAMHKMVDRATFVGTMRRVADKLGRPVSSTLQRWGQTLSVPLGRTVTAQYLTKFERGEGTEHITWTVRSGTFVLVGYYVRSPVFADE